MKDNWEHRSKGMICRTCMFFVVKNDSVAEPQPVDSPDTRGLLGRCRRNAPTMKGFPAVFQGDWCGEHKLDGSKI